MLDHYTLGKLVLTNNSALSKQDVADAGTALNVATGLRYDGADVRITAQSQIDHEKLAAEVKKKLVADPNASRAGGNLSITFDGTNAKLMLGDTEIATGAFASDVITFNDSNSQQMFTITLDPSKSVTALTDLANTTGHNNFIDLGLSVALDSADHTVDTTAMAANANAIATALDSAATAAGKTIEDGTELEISFNSTNGNYELKAGDVVVATANAAATTPTATTGDITLNFSGGLGSVTIKNLNAGFVDSDLAKSAPIKTGLTYNAAKTPAINTDFSGLVTDKLKEAAETTGVDNGTTVQAAWDGSVWSLQFSSGEKIEDGVLASDGMSVDFGDYGKMTFDRAFNTGNITTSGADIKANVETGLSYGETTTKGGISGDFLVTTSDQQNTSETAGDRLASTVLTLKDSMVTDGASIFVAGKNYTFSTGKDTVIRDGAVKVDISDLDAKKLGDDYMSAVAKRLTDAYAADNTGVYTLGWNGKNITVTETLTHGMLEDGGSNVANGKYQAQGEWDLTTFDGIKKSLGYSTAATDGKALTLQIGDTAESFNQLKVNIEDMHTAAMGASEDDALTIADISIADQDSAAKAVDVIKRAINQVSEVMKNKPCKCEYPTKIMPY